MKYRDFIEILVRHGFTCTRTVATHHRYEGFVNGERKLVTVDYAQGNEDIMIRNFQSMIRQSGLPKKLFR